MKRSDTEPDEVELRKHRFVKVRPYQWSKAAKEEEPDMPEADIESVHSAFFRPVVAKEAEE